MSLQDIPYHEKRTTCPRTNHRRVTCRTARRIKQGTAPSAVQIQQLLSTLYLLCVMSLRKSRMIRYGVVYLDVSETCDADYLSHHGRLCRSLGQSTCYCSARGGRGYGALVPFPPTCEIMRFRYVYLGRVQGPGVLVVVGDGSGCSNVGMVRLMVRTA